MIKQFLGDHPEMTGDSLQGEMHRQHPAYKPVPTKISKYVTRGRPFPTPDFLAAIGKVLGLSENEARQYAAQPYTKEERDGKGVPSQGEPKHMLVVGHTVWSAPILLAAMDGRLPRFRIVTAVDGNGAPVHIPEVGRGFSQPVRIEPGSILSPGIAGREGGLHYLSAATALGLFASSPNKDGAKVAVIPGRLAEDRASELFRVGSIADTHIGCTLVCTKEFGGKLRNYANKRVGGSAPNAKESGDNASRVTTPSLYVNERLEARGKLPCEVGIEYVVSELFGLNPDNLSEERVSTVSMVAVEPDTISHRLVEAACEILFPGSAQAAARNVMLRCPTGEMRYKKLDELRKAAHMYGKELAGVITWDPIADWMIKSSQGELEKYYVNFPFDSVPRHITFDVCMHSDSVTSSSPDAAVLRQDVLDLMMEVAPYCDGLNAIGSPVRASTRVSDWQLAALAGYFGLCDRPNLASWGDEQQEAIHKVRELLQPIRFDASVYASTFRYPGWE